LRALLVDDTADTFVAALHQLHHPEVRWKEGLTNVRSMWKERDEKGARRLFAELWADLTSSSKPLIGSQIGRYNGKWIREHKRRLEKIFGGDGRKVDEKKVAMELRAATEGVKNCKAHSKYATDEFSEWIASFDPSAGELELPGQYDHTDVDTTSSSGSAGGDGGAGANVIFQGFGGGGAGDGDVLASVSSSAEDGPSSSSSSSSSSSNHLLITGFGAQMLCMASKQKPKRLETICDDFSRQLWLVKGGEDLRLDQRIEQIFGLMNSLLGRDPQCKPRGLRNRTYKVSGLQV
jgi:DNA-dependent protein kinase catalytic subunit